MCQLTNFALEIIHHLACINYILSMFYYKVTSHIMSPSSSSLSAFPRHITEKEVSLQNTWLNTVITTVHLPLLTFHMTSLLHMYMNISRVLKPFPIPLTVWKMYMFVLSLINSNAHRAAMNGSFEAVSALKSYTTGESR